MKWEKPSERLSLVLAEALEPFLCQKKQMFGCPSYFVNDNLFAGVHQSSLMVRLPSDARERLLATVSEAKGFEPTEGRPMKEYVVLPEAVCSNPETLEGWLDLAYRYALSLPPKATKAGKRK